MFWIICCVIFEMFPKLGDEPENQKMINKKKNNSATSI